jgi:hypothetical protein
LCVPTQGNDLPLEIRMLVHSVSIYATCIGCTQ